MKKNLISGLIFLLPITVTVILIGFIVDVLTAPFLGHVENILRFFGDNYSVDFEYHTTALVLLSRIIILILLFLCVLILGFLGKKIFFNWIIKMMDNLMLRIPLIKTVYKASRDIILAVLAENKKFFSRVVLAPFPNEEARAFGLVTGNAPFQVQPAESEEQPERKLKSVFVPTSPHPISGFLLLVEERHLKPIDITVEDLFKFLISCGIFIPPAQESKVESEKPEITEKQ